MLGNFLLGTRIEEEPHFTFDILKRGFIGNSEASRALSNNFWSSSKGSGNILMLALGLDELVEASFFSLQKSLHPRPRIAVAMDHSHAKKQPSFVDLNLFGTQGSVHEILQSCTLSLSCTRNGNRDPSLQDEACLSTEPTEATFLSFSFVSKTLMLPVMSCRNLTVLNLCQFPPNTLASDAELTFSSEISPPAP